MGYRIAETNGAITVHVEGRLDAMTAPKLEDELLPMLDRSAGAAFDLAKLEFITSAGLRTLLVVYKVMSRRETPMRVVNVSGSVLELFDSTGFSDIYGIERTE